MEIDGINVNKGLTMYRNKIKIYKRLLADFLKDGNEKHKHMNDTFADKNIALYTTHVHGLRSAADAIAADKLSQAAKLLEDAGNRGDWDYIDAHNADFLLELKTLLENIDGELCKI